MYAQIVFEDNTNNFHLLPKLNPLVGRPVNFYKFFRRCLGTGGCISQIRAMWRFRARVKGRSNTSIDSEEVFGCWHSAKRASEVASSQLTSQSWPKGVAGDLFGGLFFDLVFVDKGIGKRRMLLLLLGPGRGRSSRELDPTTGSSMTEERLSQIRLP